MKEKACSVCMANCVRLHGDASDDPEGELSPVESILKENGASRPQQKKGGANLSSPAFLKKMTGITLSSELQMPASFVKISIANIGPAVTLEGPGKRTWRVAIGPGKENHSLAFGDGWRKFVSDHVLQIGDQLSFTLTAASYFQVVVFDESGSEKVSAADAINSPLTQDANGAPVTSAAQVRPKPVSRPKQKVRRKLKTENAGQSVTLVPPVAHSIESERRNSDKSKDSASVKKFEDDPDTDADEIHHFLLPPHVILEGQVVSERRPVTEEEKERALNSAKALPISNPKLVMVMSKGHVCRGFWMALSRPFAKAHMPHETRDVTLRNMAGYEWTVKWLHKDAGSGFSGGWRGFSLDHRLEAHDVCVFEIVDEESFVVRVHIFRVIGGAKEDFGAYRPGVCRARNTGQSKRKMAPDSAHPDSSSPNKCSTQAKRDSLATFSKFDNSKMVTIPKVDQPSCSKRAPKTSPKSELEDSLPITHEGKKIKCSPTTSVEVYEQYKSFVTPSPGGEETGYGADLEIRPLVSKEAADTGNLVKLGKELAHAGTS